MVTVSFSECVCLQGIYQYLGMYMHTCSSRANVVLMFTTGVNQHVLVYTVYNISGAKLSLQRSRTFFHMFHVHYIYVYSVKL